MITEKIHTALVPLATAISGGALVLFVDSRPLVYVIGAGTLLMTALYSLLAFRHTIEKQPTVHYATITFIMWAGGSAIYGLRTFQIQPLWVIIVLGLLISILIGFLWPRHTELQTVLRRVVTLLAFEWFIVLLFAPASYMVLGALYAVLVAGTASLADKQGTEQVERSSVITTIIAIALIATSFIIGFKWVL